MEYVPGITADQWFREGMLRSGTPPPVDESLGVLEQCCRGVSAIHASGTIHGDIKPSNVLLGPAFRVALTDLGLALMLERGDFDQMAGTPAYMAPESLEGIGDGELAKRRDVYSLGVMTYEFLTGKRPYNVHNAAALAEIGKQGPPVAPSQLRSDLPIAFDACLMRALAHDPRERTPSADALRRDLMQARRKASERKFAARFLVVDDDPDFLALVDRSLRASFPGASVACVADGAEGLARIEQQPFDLLILDLMLPDYNGVEIVAAIRESHPHLKMPILIVTAFGGGKDWQLLSRLGANGFLVKPVDPNALAAMAGRMLETPRTSRAG
jgi:eukaryotic-like serine/threonine-protein kinase